MKYDFDVVIDRKESGSLKWNKYGERDIIPMWVADMDFRCPPALLEALHRQIEHGIFGYSLPKKELIEALVEHLHVKCNWRIDPGWVVWLPGLVSGLNVVCRCIGENQDEVLCYVPAYPPFLTAPALSRKKLKTVPLSRKDHKFYMDAEALKGACTDRSKVFILCHPHNPVGREYYADELKAVAEVCLARDVVICSDEIHGDLILDERRHVPTASLSEDIADKTITLLSPSKTYNTPGLNCALAIISNEKLRKEFAHACEGILPDFNALGLIAALAAYRDGEDWRRELIQYLRQNRDIVQDYINHQIPCLSMDHVEATYLAWINITQLGASDPAGFFEAAGVGLSAGRFFHDADYVRLNFGCPQKILREGLNRIKQAVEQHCRNA